MKQKKQDILRFQFELTPTEMTELEEICLASSVRTKKQLVRDALGLLKSHIEKSEQGYQRAYVSKADPTKIIHVENPCDNYRLHRR